jgi:hypothetical protein
MLQQVVEENFEGAGLSPPWPDNPVWDFSVTFFLYCCHQIDSLGEVCLFILHDFLILSVTHVHMLTPMLSMPLYFTGDSSLPKRKRQLIQNEEGVLVDEVAIH